MLKEIVWGAGLRGTLSLETQGDFGVCRKRLGRRPALPSSEAHREESETAETDVSRFQSILET